MAPNVRWHPNGNMPTRVVDTAGRVHHYNKHGQEHNDHGPSYEYGNGNYEWKRNGQFHRLNGPALRFTGEDGVRESYWIEGVRYDDMDDFSKAAADFCKRTGE